MLPQTDRYLFQYRKFTGSHHFYHGLLATLAIVSPVLALSYLGYAHLGLAMALGALCLTIVDNPGPLHHRRNAMLFTIVALFAFIMVTGFLLRYPVLLVIWLMVAGFILSFVSVFGSRTANVGSACMLMMVLSLDEQKTMMQLLETASLASLGGLFYYLVSMGANRLMPYKLAQQVLGDCLHQTAEFLRMKGELYNASVDLQRAVQQLNAQQVNVHASQEAVREILFKTREFVKESTHNGRILVMMFLETVDLFENVLSSQQDHGNLRKQFGQTGILQEYEKVIADLAYDIEQIALAVQTGKPAVANMASENSLEKLGKQLQMLKTAQGSAAGTAGLEQVYANMVDIRKQIETMRSLSTYHPNIRVKSNVQLRQFVDPTQINTRILRNNLNLGSNVFRFSIRVALAVMAGFMFSQFFDVGHFYWIILTITVILKPAYALTKKRNKERLLGTLAGAVIGLLIVALIQNTTALTIIVVACMIATYSLLRTRYQPAVIFMTIYVIIALQLLNFSTSETLFADRILDTLVGSLIAWTATLVIPPLWEKSRISGLLADCYEASRHYFEYLSGVFMGIPLEAHAFKLKRKKAYVALANLNEAFRSMLNEPSGRRVKGEYLHQLVVGCHMLMSYLATYRDYAETMPAEGETFPVEIPAKEISSKLKQAEELLRDENTQPDKFPPPERVDWNLELREPLLGQLKLLNRASGDILRVTKLLERGNAT